MRYAGRAVGADEILARRGDGNDDEGILPAHTARLVIADDAGAARFDAWLTMGDSGAVFDLGTEKVVAEIIQGGVESRDRLLRLSLPGVLAFKAPKATSTKKKAAGDTKKAATTKKATSSTKKPVTTKQAATTKKKAAATTKKKAATKKS